MSTALNKPPDAWHMEEDDIHVWISPLQTSPDILKRFNEILSHDEKVRAARFGTKLLQDRFVAGRGMLRTVLAGYLDGKPGNLKFIYSQAGQPTLSEDIATNGINFNLAHSDNLLAIAVARDRLVGIDIEKIQTIADAEQLVTRFFSAAEQRSFKELPPEQKTAAFYNLWTRKEAWLKATGEGISRLLDQVEVTFAPGKPAQLIRLPSLSRATAGQWSIHEISLLSGYAGAVAVNALENRLIYRRLDNIAAILV